MRILPVLDLQHGHVVRGVAGRRHEYRPIRSRLTASSEPVAVAQAFRDQFGLTELYLADLDALAGAPPGLDHYRALQRLGCRLWVDAGVRTAADAIPLAGVGVDCIVVGLETCAGPEALADICRRFGSDRVAFSLDLKGGQPLRTSSVWGATPIEIAERALAAGVRRLIVLDLERVGMGAGTGTEALCRHLTEQQAEVECLAGGGIRGIEDLRGLECQGVKGVLIASALHDGRITRDDIASAVATRARNRSTRAL